MKEFNYIVKMNFIGEFIILHLKRIGKLNIYIRIHARYLRQVHIVSKLLNIIEVYLRRINII